MMVYVVLFGKPYDGDDWGTHGDRIYTSKNLAVERAHQLNVEFEHENSMYRAWWEEIEVQSKLDPWEPPEPPPPSPDPVPVYMSMYYPYYNKIIVEPHGKRPIEEGEVKFWDGEAPSPWAMSNSLDKLADHWRKYMQLKGNTDYSIEIKGDVPQ